MGYQEAWWRVWREIQRARGLSLEEALSGLNSKQMAWFAQWAFEQDEITDALLAYRRYLDHPPEMGTNPRHNAIYLDHLLWRQRYAEVLETVAELQADGDDLPDEEIRAVRALFLLDDQEAAMSRLARLRERHHDNGSVWAVSAILSTALGEREQAHEALEECARLGVYDRGLEHELLDALGITPEAWEAQRAPYLPEPWDFDERTRRWWADPGARLWPADCPTRHWYGGDEFRMPACRGCGHPIRQWFLLDLRDIESLGRRLPSWTLFPLVGCMDCCAWLFRHDYRVRPGGMQVELVNVAISHKQFGLPNRTVLPIPRQFVHLEWVPPRLSPTKEEMEQFCAGDWDRPQIAGRPAWVQHPQRVFCKSCRQEMVFAAAMATTSDFEPTVQINNGSGFQYHFACDACHTISVIAQNT